MRLLFENGQILMMMYICWIFRTLNLINANTTIFTLYRKGAYTQIHIHTSAYAAHLKSTQWILVPFESQRFDIFLMFPVYLGFAMQTIFSKWFIVFGEKMWNHPLSFWKNWFWIHVINMLIFNFPMLLKLERYIIFVKNKLILEHHYYFRYVG